MKKNLFVLGLMMCLLSCSKKPTNPLIGLWSRSYLIPVLGIHTDESYEFLEDGRCIHLRQSSTYNPGYSGSTRPINKSIKYSIIDENTLILDGEEIYYFLSSDNVTLILGNDTYKRF